MLSVCCVLRVLRICVVRVLLLFDGVVCMSCLRKFRVLCEICVCCLLRVFCARLFCV